MGAFAATQATGGQQRHVSFRERSMAMLGSILFIQGGKDTERDGRPPDLEARETATLAD
jgi:hypothetical protein